MSRFLRGVLIGLATGLGLTVWIVKRQRPYVCSLERPGDLECGSVPARWTVEVANAVMSYIAAAAVLLIVAWLVLGLYRAWQGHRRSLADAT